MRGIVFASALGGLGMGYGRADRVVIAVAEKEAGEGVARVSGGSSVLSPFIRINLSPFTKDFRGGGYHDSEEKFFLVPDGILRWADNRSKQKASLS